MSTAISERFEAAKAFSARLSSPHYRKLYADIDNVVPVTLDDTVHYVIDRVVECDGATVVVIDEAGVLNLLDMTVYQPASAERPLFNAANEQPVGRGSNVGTLLEFLRLTEGPQRIVKAPDVEAYLRNSERPLESA